ncbi:MarR family winged helix-turn-helix transcriptional regulator [Microbacterium paraoxydans]|uniref:DNA-binding transcriptional regulator, MarR family n=1 Tax=Microbacterium paraoxydans TaxID=199592 RepID=A0ABS5IL81_9MICO|nr:hypothetical protein [Microbacterium paraoxydans]MBS0023711.1 hypothetical protein [Microbacterium paraoxydans]
MTTTTDTPGTPQSRPFGYWLKAVDRLMAAEFAAAFDGEGITRRDWRLLNVVDGTADHDRPLNPHKLHRLIDRGWVTADGEGWALTDDGRAAKERLGALVDGIRAKVVDAVPAEDLDTTLASLEAIARAFGWEEGTPLPRTHRDPRGHRHRRGFGFPGPFGRHDFGPRSFAEHGSGPRSFGHGFGEHGFDRHGLDGRDDHGRGHDHGRGGFGHGHDPRGFDERHGHAAPEGPCGHGHRHGHGRPGERRARHAFERGFDAGFQRGRDS